MWAEVVEEYFAVDELEMVVSRRLGIVLAEGESVILDVLAYELLTGRQ